MTKTRLEIQFSPSLNKFPQQESLAHWPNTIFQTEGGVKVGAALKLVGETLCASLVISNNSPQPVRLTRKRLCEVTVSETGRTERDFPLVKRRATLRGKKLLSGGTAKGKLYFDAGSLEENHSPVQLTLSVGDERFVFQFEAPKNAVEVLADVSKAKSNGKSNGSGKKPDARRISRKLKPKQRKFIAHYTDPTKDTFGNGTKSAVAAGYSEKSATVQASQVLTNPKVGREIELALDEAGVTREKIARVLHNGLEAKQQRVFCQDGQLTYSKKMEDHPTQVRAAEVVGKMRGFFPTTHTIERRELLAIQQNIIVVPTEPPPGTSKKEKLVRQLEE